MVSKSLMCYFIFVINFANCVDQNDVDYYVRLIEEEIQRSKTFKLPQDASEYRPITEDIRAFGTWDYIIVGSGSAGSVIASRLSENPSMRVLLIEAGGFESNFTDIPCMSVYLQQLEYNWNFITTPQSNACLGKGLGGSSLINNVKYTRGNQKDYDSWYSLGNPGWSYADLLPLFKKSESVHFSNADLTYHGTCGNLHVKHEKPIHPQTMSFIEANEYLGRPQVDFNAKSQLGVGITQFNTFKGKRQSVARAFVFPVLGRNNLRVLTQSYATKVLINPSTKKTYGVQFARNGVLYEARIRKEVIVSAGAIGSPHLLMLSGIGPADHLQKVGIPVIRNLSVGNNLQDHVGYFELHFVSNYTEPVRSLRENVERYLNGLGPFTVSTNSQGLAFVQIKYNSSGVPDIELVMNPSNLNVTNTKVIYNYKDDTFDALLSDVNVRQTFRIYAILEHEKSRGTLRLKSADPYDYPLIDLNFLSHPDDIESLYQGIQLVLQLLHAPAFKKMNVNLVRNPLPACKHLTYLSKEFWYCQIRQVGTGFNHQVATCTMGPSVQQGAVVDHELKVHGVSNLRVADASIMPLVTSGHISSAAIVIGEKVSQMIKERQMENEEFCTLADYIRLEICVTTYVLSKTIYCIYGLWYY